MIYYTRTQIVEILGLEDGFVVSLEREDIISSDAPQGAAGEFSEQMLERARVAANLVGELEVNLPGAAIIVRMREEMADLRRQMAQLLEQFERDA